MMPELRRIEHTTLARGRVDAAAMRPLRQMVSAGGSIEDKERKLLHALRGEAPQTSPKVKALLQEGMT